MQVLSGKCRSAEARANKAVAYSMNRESFHIVLELWTVVAVRGKVAFIDRVHRVSTVSGLMIRSSATVACLDLGGKLGYEALPPGSGNEAGNFGLQRANTTVDHVRCEGSSSRGTSQQRRADGRIQVPKFRCGCSAL